MNLSHNLKILVDTLTMRINCIKIEKAVLDAVEAELAHQKRNLEKILKDQD